MASMNTERLYRMCGCVSMDYNSGTKQNVNVFFFATLYKAVSKFMIPAICQCEWPGAGEENQKIHISCGFAKIHQRLCPHFKHTVRSVSFHLVLGSQPCMISPITNQQSSPWSHLIVRFVTADTLNMSNYEEDCVWQGNWAAYVFSVKWQEWRIDPETHTKIAISILDVLRKTDSSSSSSPNRTASEFPTLMNPKHPGPFKSLRLKQWRDPDCQQARSQVFGLRSVYSAHISFTRCQHASPLSTCLSAALRSQLANVPTRKRLCWNPKGEAFALPPVKTPAVRRELHSRHQVSTVVHPVAFTFVGYRKNG